MLSVSEHVCSYKWQYGWRTGTDLKGRMSGLIQLFSHRFPSVTSRATSNIWVRALVTNPLPPTNQIFIAALFLLLSIMFLTCWFKNTEVNIHLFFNLNNRRESVFGTVTIVWRYVPWCVRGIKFSYLLQNFQHRSGAQPSYYLRFLLGFKATRAWTWHLTASECRNWKWVEVKVNFPYLSSWEGLAHLDCHLTECSALCSGRFIPKERPLLGTTMKLWGLQV